MEYIFICSAGLLLMLLFWQYIWIKAWIDHTRDKLFDLRDGMRQHFIAIGRDLEKDTAYHALRTLLNQHLKHVRFISIGNFIVTQKFLMRAEAEKESVLFIEEMNKNMQTDDPELNDYITQIRSQASGIITFYLLITNPFTALAIGICYGAVVPIVVFMGMIERGISSFMSRILIRFIKFAPVEKYIMATFI